MSVYLRRIPLRISICGVITHPSHNTSLPRLIHHIAISAQGGCDQAEVDQAEGEHNRDDDAGNAGFGRRHCSSVRVGRRSSAPDEGHDTDDVENH